MNSSVMHCHQNYPNEELLDDDIPMKTTDCLKDIY